MISREDAILWIGAGASLHAGLPSGNALTAIIRNTLSKRELNDIDPNLSLQDLCEEFCRLKGGSRNALIEVLKITLLNKYLPDDSFYRTIALIPHFKTIITTNYDNLLEQAYKGHVDVVHSPSQIPYLKPTVPHIIKVHGDLSQPDSVIITKSDYNDFFKNETSQNDMWTIVKERLITKNVIFIGYNFEDANTSIVFEKISESLGRNRKQAILIAPSLKPHKVNDLIRKGIDYVDSTAEIFFTKLNQHIQDTIVEHLQNNSTSILSAQRYFSNHNLDIEIVHKGDQSKISSVAPLHDKLKALLKFSINSDSPTVKNIDDFLNGRRFDDVEINGVDAETLKLTVQGINLVSNKKDSKIILKARPVFKSKVSLRFEDGFEVSDVYLEVFRSKFLINAIANFESATIKLQFNILENIEKSISFVYEHKEEFQSINNEIQFFGFLSRLAAGELYTIFSENGISASFTKAGIMPELAKEATFFLAYLDNLKIIERNYNMLFPRLRLSEISDATSIDLRFIVNAIEKKLSVVEWDDVAEFDPKEIGIVDIDKLMEKFSEPNSCLAGVEEEDSIFKIHGKQINLGKKTVQIHNPIIINIDAFKSGEDQKYKITSGSKELSISYLSQPEKP